SNLIHPLTEWVLKTALSDLASWMANGIELTLAINISTRNLTNPRFHSIVATALERNGIAPECLELEVTEGAIMQDPVRATGLLDELAASLVVISIDDFGAGHSSLAYLSRLPATIIKIDQGFIRNMRPFSGESHI